MLTDEMLNREFTRVFKGYDTDEVEDYIEALVELYNQVANENRELALRCDALNKALEDDKIKIAQAESVTARRDEIIAEAEREAHDTVLDAREKAQAAIDTAETTARELLIEIKEKSERTESEIKDKTAQTDARCKAALDDAMEQARALIKATKINCRKRQLESEEKIKAAEAEIEKKLAAKKEEYAFLCDRASEFCRKLFEAYSEQITAIQSLELDVGENTLTVEAECPESSEITQVPVTEKAENSEGAAVIDEPDTAAETAVADEVDEVEGFDEIEEADELDETADADTTDTDKDNDTAEPETHEMQEVELVADETEEPSPIDEPETADVEETVKAAYDAEDAQTSTEPSERTVVFSVPKSDASEKKYAPFEIHKERSGVVAYDSSELSSVRHKLEDITAKKGDSFQSARQTVSKKLGFLK